MAPRRKTVSVGGCLVPTTARAVYSRNKANFRSQVAVGDGLSGWSMCYLAANEVLRWTFRPLLPCLVSALWMMFIPGLASAQSAEAQSRTAGAVQGAVK